MKKTRLRQNGTLTCTKCPEKTNRVTIYNEIIQLCPDCNKVAFKNGEYVE